MELENLPNISINATHNSQRFVSPWFDYIILMRNICVPVLVSVGLFGNTLCLVVFCAKRMKRTSSCVFLASLAVVDNIFLVCLLITWIAGQIYVILTVDFACQLLIFTTYVTSSLSVWFIVCFTCERFIAICFPLKNTYLCNVSREKGTVIIFTVFACAFYHFSFWTTGMEQLGPQLRCIHKPKYIHFLQIVTWVDTFFTMILPFLLIVYMNAMVLRKVLTCQANSKVVQLQTGQTNVHKMATLLNGKVITSIQRQHRVRLTKIQQIYPQIRITRTLLLVSTTFLVLNLPSHSIRLYNLIAFVSSSYQDVSEQFIFLQELTLLFYYMTFSCNFFLYTCFGHNFKTSLSHILHCRSTKEHRRRIVLQKLSSTQGTCISTL